MSDMEADYRIMLDAELVRRKTRNASYSMRAFARDLDVDGGYLSKLLAGKLIPSVDAAAMMAERIKLVGTQRATFIKSVAEEQMCHMLYNVDPSLTDCAPEASEMNLQPLPRGSA